MFGQLLGCHHGRRQRELRLYGRLKVFVSEWNGVKCDVRNNNHFLEKLRFFNCTVLTMYLSLRYPRFSPSVSVAWALPSPDGDSRPTFLCSIGFLCSVSTSDDAHHWPERSGWETGKERAAGARAGAGEGVASG